MAVATYITSQVLKDEEIRHLREVFVSLDHNYDGRLSRQELCDGYNKAMNLQLTDEEIGEILTKIDADGNGYIEYNEFLTSTVEKSKMLSQQNLKQAFNEFDRDGSGKISAGEVR
jgi:calcium-dependent protein kinase